MNTPDTTDSTSTRTPLHLVSTTSGLSTSATLAIHEMVAERRIKGHKIIHLGFGEAVLPLHPLLKTALAETAHHTGYAPVLGIAPLRQAIATYLARTRGISCNSEQIIVGPGSKPLLYALLHILDGDVLLPVPSWVSYAPIIHLAGRQIIEVPTDDADHHRLTPHILDDAFIKAHREGKNPRILIVNTPSNPTGSMFDQADTEAIALWAREMGITLISDEIYAELAHGWRKHISPALFYPEGTIITGGLSKAYSAGGWRLGYAALPATIAGKNAQAALRALASEIWSAAPTPIQEAALLAFTQNDAIEQYVQHSALIYGYITSQLYKTLRQSGIPCPRPAGGFYLYPDFSPWRSALLQEGVKTSQELAHYLLEHWNIATLPGSAFGEEPETLRLRLSTSLLCEPEQGTAPEERNAILWNLLDQAEGLQSMAEKQSDTPSLPLLEQTQTRWIEIMHKLDSQR